MATTGIGSGLCGGNVLAMAIEGPGGTDRRRALCQVGQEDKQGRGQGVQRQLLVGYSDRVTITHSTIQQTKRSYCPSLVLLCATYIL